MSDYHKVQQQLDDGIKPELLCAACPWDRLCITPPTMSSDEVKAKLNETRDFGAIADKRARDAALGTLMLNALAFVGKDQQAALCPVFALRIRTEEGRDINTLIRRQMRGEEAPAHA